MTQLEKTLSAIQEHLLPRKKSAANEPSEFDKAFSMLVHAYIKAAMPDVLKREIGFKVLDRDEEGYRGVGTVALDLGNLIGYGLFFFDTGKLYGKELLYLPDADLIVPFTEDWISTLSSSEWGTIGAPIDKTQFPGDVPNVRYLFESPRKKSASAPQKWEPLLIKFAEECPAIARTVVEIFAKRAEFLKQYAEVFGREAVERITKAAQANPLPDDYPDSPRRTVRMIRYGSDPIPQFLTDDEKSTLLKKGYLILDTRRRTARAVRYDAEKLASVISEPDNPVLLTVKGQQIIYIPHNKLILDPQCDKHHTYPFAREKGGVILIPSEEGNPGAIYEKVRPVRIDKRKEPEASRLFEAFAAKQPTIRDLLNRTNPAWEGQMVDVVLYDEESGKAIACENAYFSSLGDQLILEKPLEWVIKSHPGTGFIYKEHPSDKYTIYVPEKAKVLLFVGADNQRLDHAYHVDDALDSELAGLDMSLAKAAELEISARDGVYAINRKPFLDRASAVWHLVSDWNLTEKNAEEILNEAGAWPQKYCIIGPRREEKQAQMPFAGPQPMPMAAPAAPPPGVPAPVGPDQMAQLDPAMRSRVPQAQDTAILAVALQANSNETIIDQYLPGLLMGINALGHVILNMIWHRERLEDRYGKNDYEALLDLIRDTFVNAGKIYLKLRGKGPEIIKDMDKVSEISRG